MRLLTLLTLWLLPFTLSAVTVSIDIPSNLKQNVLLQHTLKDVQQLISKASGEPCVFGSNGQVVLRLSAQTDTSVDIFKRYDFIDSIDRIAYPKHNYSWRSSVKGKQLIHTLNSPSVQGLSFGLYGLLQEKLGFDFYHPRETHVPEFQIWPLTPDLNWEVTPRFRMKGFHLHTMHPIELTEYLLNHESGGLPHVKEYLDWLARNQQNYFEFNLLEDIHKKKWAPYAAQFVEYAHERGIVIGVDISLHMLQQKAYMLYKSPLKKFASKKKQSLKNLDYLAVADFDVYSIEFSTTEYTDGNSKRKNQLMADIIHHARLKYNAKAMSRHHVVKKSDMLGADDESSGRKKHPPSPFQDSVDNLKGALVHTVMCYGLTTKKARVYGNKNLWHMHDLLLEEKEKRETWYYPESAYWVTFDNSVPNFLLPYLIERKKDILLCDSLGIDGHLTFSSGWEWGYWLFDWNIARGCWDYDQEIRELPTFQSELTPLVEKMKKLQDEHLINKELMQFLAASSVTDEMKGRFNLQFQPRPRLTYEHLMNNALDNELHEYYGYVNQLHQFASKTWDLLQEQPKEVLENPAHAELLRGMEILYWRTVHRAATLHYLILHRQEKLNKSKLDDRKTVQKEMWERARTKAQVLVDEAEKGYRYPMELIVHKRRQDYTCYRFGYLYTVHELHFWNREEQQVLRNRWGYGFKNIYNIARTIGLIN